MEDKRGQVGQPETFTPSVDRVTFEILRHRLWQINDEQGTTILRVSGSPIAAEMQDFNVGIATADGTLVCAGAYLLAHISSMSIVIKNCMKTIGLDRIRPGDMFITNDPWMGAVHQNDLALVAPIHWEGELVGWTGSVIHESDVGGPVPGSWNRNATDAYQEAPRYRFLKIVSEGRIAPEVMDTYLTNLRNPDQSEVDLLAQIAAAGVVKERLHVLFSKYGVSAVTSVMKDCVRNTELLLRNRLREIPDGTWHAEDYCDHDGHRDSVSTVRVTLTKRGDQLIFDFTRSDPQTDGFINCTYPALLSAPFGVLLTYLGSDIQWNEGAMKLVQVISKEGTLVHAKFPAPVGSGIVNAAWSALNACSQAMAQMLLASDTHKDKMMAVWAGAPTGVNIHGINQYGERTSSLLGLSSLQGAGARYFADGYDIAGSLLFPRGGVMNVETVENRYPVMHFYRKRAIDSGGPGRFRGGTGVELAFFPYATKELDVYTSSFGADQSGSSGVAGGLPGGGSNMIQVLNCDPLEMMHSGRFPSHLTDFEAEAVHHPAKSHFKLSARDAVVVSTHGGGGFGDPLFREPKRVLQDVAAGFVSAERAREIYGVVLDPAGQRADEEATRTRRGQILEERKNGKIGERLAAEELAKLSSDERLSASLAHIWQAQDAWVCRECGGTFGKAGERPHDKLIVVRRELGDAGPWIAKRWGGRSPRFKLIQAFCPHCGHLLHSGQFKWPPAE